MPDIPVWLAAILTPGAAGFVWVLFKGLDLWRNGTAAQEVRAIRNLEKFAERESIRADYNGDLADYYRRWSGTLEWIIRTHPSLGPSAIPPMPPAPMPRPVQRNRRHDDNQEVATS